MTEIQLSISVLSASCGNLQSPFSSNNSVKQERKKKGRKAEKKTKYFSEETF